MSTFPNNPKLKMALIAPLFFDYYKEIIAEGQEQGYQVDYFCDAPSNSNISKALGRINKKIIGKQTEYYFDNKVFPHFQQKQYDVVLLVAGMTFSFTSNMIKKIKDSQRKAKFLLYQWDSEKNLPFAKSIHFAFDSVYSFDRFDVKKNNIYKFLPLFYTKKYSDIGNAGSKEFLYDCMYVGTAHPKKFLEINQIAKTIKPVYKRQYIYHYLPSYLKFVYHKMFAPEYKTARWRDFKKNKLSTEQILDILIKSNCVLDAPQSGQTGLTMRTFECLGANKKLITTNVDIKNYDFYDSQNILIYDGNVDFNSSFFRKGYKLLPENIYRKYSLSSWFNQILK